MSAYSGFGGFSPLYKYYEFELDSMDCVRSKYNNRLLGLIVSIQRRTGPCSRLVVKDLCRILPR